MSRSSLGIAAVIASTFGLGLSYGIGYPLTSLTLAGWGQPKWVIGLAAGLPQLGVMALLPFAPRLAARLGTVRTMLLGGLLTIAGFGAMGSSDSLAVWLLARLVMGLGMTLPWLLGETWINHAVDDRHRGRVLAAYAVSLFSGFGIGPLLVETLGLTGPPIFIAGAASMALSALPLVLAARWAPSLAIERGQGVASVMRLVPYAMLGAFLAGAVEVSYTSLWSVVAVAQGLPAADGLRLLSVLMVGGVLLQLGVGLLADRMDRRTLLAAIGAALVLLTLVAVAWMEVPSLGVAASFATGGAVIAIYMVALAVLGERVAASQLALANAAFMMCYQVGAVAWPLMTGALMDLWGVAGFTASIVAAGVLLIGGRRFGARDAAPLRA